MHFTNENVVISIICSNCFQRIGVFISAVVNVVVVVSIELTVSISHLSVTVEFTCVAVFLISTAMRTPYLFFYRVRMRLFSVLVLSPRR